jgi:hypothetical protein
MSRIAGTAPAALLPAFLAAARAQLDNAKEKR